MKITFVLPRAPINAIGGFKVVYQYANFFASKGHEVNIVHIAYFKNLPNPLMLTNEIKFKVKKALVTLHLSKINRKINWFKFDNRVNIFHFNYADNSVLPEADIVIATAWQTANFVNELPLKCGIKYYFIQHYEVWSGPKTFVDQTWKLPLKKIVIASWLQKIGNGMGVKTTVVKNFVDPMEFFMNNSISNRENVVSILYHTSKWKGTNTGLQALAIVHRRHPDLKVYLFGVFKKPKGLPDYVFYFKNPSKKYLRNNIYNQSKVYVLPSIKEGWGLTATEAMCCGAALCSTNNGGVDDFGVDKETALISTISDESELAKNICCLLEDEALRIKLATDGKKRVDNLTLDRSGNAFLEELSKSIAGKTY